MQLGSSTFEPNELPNTEATYIRGHGVAIEASEVAGDDFESLKQQGLIQTKQNEDGYTIFIFNDYGHTAAHEELAAEIETASGSEDGNEDGDEDEDEDDEDEDESNTAFKGRSTPPTTVEWHEKCVEGISEALEKDFKIKCYLQVMTACDRRDPKRVKHLMKLDYLKLEISDCVNNEKHRGHFVHRIIVCVKPREEWRTKIDRVIALPSDDSQKREYAIQTTNNKGVAGTVTSVGQLQLQVSHNRSTGLGYSTSEHEWERARVDDNPDKQDWSVEWEWNLKRWKDGQAFNQKKPWKFSGPLPEIPYGLPRFAFTEVDHNWAEWSASPEKINGIEKIEWDVEVQFCTISPKRRILTRTGYEFCGCGPGQIRSIRARIPGPAGRYFWGRVFR